MVERSATGGSKTIVIRAPANESKKQKEPKVINFEVKPRNNVTWTDDTVDNEFFNKRKSKICCKYEKPRTHPDDSSSSSCSSGSDCGNNYDKFPKHQRRAMREKKNPVNDSDL